MVGIPQTKGLVVLDREQRFPIEIENVDRYIDAIPSPLRPTPVDGRNRRRRRSIHRARRKGHAAGRERLEGGELDPLVDTVDRNEPGFLDGSLLVVDARFERSGLRE